MEVRLTVQSTVNFVSEISDQNPSIEFDKHLEHVVVGVPFREGHWHLTPRLLTPRFEGHLVGQHGTWLNRTVFNFVHHPPRQFG